MPTLYEKPLDYTPQSTFVPQPLELIGKVMEMQANKYDKAKALIQASENSWLKSDHSVNDTDIYNNTINAYEKRIDEAVANAGGDYSTLTAFADSLVKDINFDSTQGVLAHLKNNKALIEKEKETLDKDYKDAKIGYGGYIKGLEAISNFKTTLDSQGNFTTFNRYTPSNVANPIETMSKVLKDLPDKTNDEGIDFKGVRALTETLNMELANNPDIEKALIENFNIQYNGKKDSKSIQENYLKYKDNIINKIVADQSYTRNKPENVNGTIPSKVIDNVQIPEGLQNGIFNYTGGNAAVARSAIQNIFGLKTEKAFKDSTNTDEAKNIIHNLEISSGTKYPTTYKEQVKWLDKTIHAPKVGRVITKTITSKDTSRIIDANGNLLNENGVYNREGKKVSDFSALSPSTDKKPYVVGVVDIGSDLPPNSALIKGTDGELYVQPPTDTKTLLSADYNMWKVYNIGKSNTGNGVINIEDINTTGGVTISKGTYKATVRYGNTKSGEATRKLIVLSQNGKPKFSIEATEDPRHPIIYTY